MLPVTLPMGAIFGAVCMEFFIEAELSINEMGFIYLTPSLF